MLRVEIEIVMHRTECCAWTHSYASDIRKSHRGYCPLDLTRPANRVPLGDITPLPLFPISSCFRCWQCMIVDSVTVSSFLRTSTKW